MTIDNVACFVLFALGKTDSICFAQSPGAHFSEMTTKVIERVSLYVKTTQTQSGPIVEYQVWHVRNETVLYESISRVTTRSGRRIPTVTTRLFNGRECWTADARGKRASVSSNQPLRFLEMDRGVYLAMRSPMGGPFAGLTWKSILEQPSGGFPAKDDAIQLAKTFPNSENKFLVNHMHSTANTYSAHSNLMVGMVSCVEDKSSIRLRFSGRNEELQPVSTIRIDFGSKTDSIALDDGGTMQVRFAISPPLAQIDESTTFTLAVTTQQIGQRPAEARIMRIETAAIDETILADIEDLAILLDVGASITQRDHQTKYSWTTSADPLVSDSPLPYSVSGLLFPAQIPQMLDELGVN